MNNITEEARSNTSKIISKLLKEQEEREMTMKEALRKKREEMNVVKGELASDYVDRADEAVNGLKDTLMGVCNYIGDVLGFTTIKDMIVDIYASEDNLVKASKKVSSEINDIINTFKAVDPDDKFGTIAKLHEVVYEDGEEVCYRQSIFMAITNTIIWIGKKVARKLRKWFGLTEETNILGSVGVKISSCFKNISTTVVKIAKNVGKFTTYVFSYVAAAAIKVGCLVIKAIKFALSKVKGWIEKASVKLDEKLAEEDPGEDEALDEECGTKESFDAMLEDC